MVTVERTSSNQSDRSIVDVPLSFFEDALTPYSCPLRPHQIIRCTGLQLVLFRHPLQCSSLPPKTARLQCLPATIWWPSPGPRGPHERAFISRWPHLLIIPEHFDEPSPETSNCSHCPSSRALSAWRGQSSPFGRGEKRTHAPRRRQHGPGYLHWRSCGLYSYSTSGHILGKYRSSTTSSATF